MWTFQEYCDGNDSWAVRALELRAPAPPTIVSASPSSAGVGRTVEVTLSGSSVNGTAFFEPGVTYPSHLRVSVAGVGVAVLAARVPDPTRVIVTLAVAPDAPVGTRLVTVTNPDGQSIASDSVLSVGPAIDTVSVKKGSTGNRAAAISGAGFGSASTVTVDGVGFRALARVTGGTSIRQKGKLTDGRSISKAIRRGQTVTIGVETSAGVLATIQYTRP